MRVAKKSIGKRPSTVLISIYALSLDSTMLKMKQIHTIKRHRSKNLCGTITVQEPLKLKANEKNPCFIILNKLLQN